MVTSLVVKPCRGELVANKYHFLNSLNIGYIVIDLQHILLKQIDTALSGSFFQDINEAHCTL